MFVAKLTINVIPPECGCAKAIPTRNFDVRSPAPAEKPEMKLRENLAMSVLTLWL